MRLANLAHRKPRTQAETDRWLRDQAWRLNNLYWIQTKEGGKKLKFRFNWAQEQFYQALWYNNLVLKARQFGFSTLIDLIILDTCLFNPDIAAGVIAHDRESAEELYRRNIQFPYDHLPEGIRSAQPADRRNAQTLRFPNGSGIRVATSVRSATTHLLHISEFGKICAKYPDKAREIVTGSLETVGQGQTVFIESTAEGAEGYFYDYCQEARARAESHRPLGTMDWKLHFFAWWQHPDYRLSAEEANQVPINLDHKRYFFELEAEIGRKLSVERRAWWVKKAERLGEDIYREYPSTPEEAFRASTEGAFYARQVAQAYKEGRVTALPAEPGVPINTFWDIGIKDFGAIWLHQRVKERDHFIGYLEAMDQPLQHYANLIFEYRARGFVIGTHYMPHDARKRDPKDGITYMDYARKLGLVPLIVVDTPDLVAGRQATREKLASCWFDKDACDLGLKRLAQFRKEWSATLGGYMEKERHDDNSHGASAFRMFAQGYKPAGEVALEITENGAEPVKWTRRRSNWRVA